MFARASPAFLHIASKEHDNGVKVGICHAADPIGGVIRSGCAEDIRSGGHSLTKLFWKSQQRRVIKANSPQPIPCECDGDPSGIELARLDCLCGTDFGKDACQPCTSAYRVGKP